MVRAVSDAIAQPYKSIPTLPSQMPNSCLCKAFANRLSSWSRQNGMVDACGHRQPPESEVVNSSKSSSLVFVVMEKDVAQYIGPKIKDSTYSSQQSVV
jgi:hypothetical protein